MWVTMGHAVDLPVSSFVEALLWRKCSWLSFSVFNPLNLSTSRMTSFRQCNDYTWNREDDVWQKRAVLQTPAEWRFCSVHLNGSVFIVTTDRKVVTALCVCVLSLIHI